MKMPKGYYLLLLLGFLTALNVQAKPWKGAELITRETYKYGAFEARVRSAKGSGMVTAFFLWKDGSEIPGAQWQEQDFEMFGKDGKYQTQLMTPGNPRTENAVIHQLSAPATDHYFTYRMEWTPNYLAFYVDGHLVRRETDRVTYAKMFEPLAEPTQLRMSLWAGDWSWSGLFDAASAPAHTYVEFLQVFNYTPGAGPNGSDFTLRWRDDFTGTSINTNRWWFANWTFEFAVNDYVSRNAAIRNGKLVLALTDEATSGQFPATAPEDNPPLPPFDPIGPQPENYFPILVPARIEAENFSAYRDTTPGNQGNSPCINSSYYVDTEITQDISGVCHLSNTAAGEWTEYKIEVPETADYYLFLRASSGRAGTKVHVEVDGVSASAALDIPNNGWQVFSDVPVLLNLTAGTHTLRVVHDTGFANLNYLELELASTTDPDLPVVLPARIEAEKFVDYFDTTPGNQGNVNCNTQDMDAELTGDTTGLCNLGKIVAGEWVEYAVNVPEAGAYNLSLRAATNQSGTMSFHIEVDGVSHAWPVAVPRKGWQVYSDVLVPLPLILEAGDHIIRVVFDTGNINLNYLVFEETVIVEPEPVAIPARIEAEAFTAAFDTTPGNTGALQCNTGDVDTELTNDSGGVCNIANTAAGEWTEYEISTTGGSFNLAVRAATNSTNVRLRVLIDGLDVSGALAVPRKGWQVYSDLIVPVELPAGTYVVRLLYETGLANVNFITFSAAASSSSAGSSSLASSSQSSAVSSASSSLASSSAASSSSSLASSIASSSSSSAESSSASSLSSSAVSSVESSSSSSAESSVASSLASSAASSLSSSAESSIASSSGSSAASSLESSSSSSVESSSASSLSSSSASSVESSSSSSAESSVASSLSISSASSVESSSSSNAVSSVASSSSSSAISSVASSLSSSVASSIAPSSSSSAVSSIASSLNSSLASSSRSSALSSIASSSRSSALSSLASSSRSSAVSSLASSSRSSLASSAASSVASSARAAGSCSYAIVSNWGSGFTGTIRITNRGTSAINGWQLNWRYNGSTRLVTSWGGNLVGSNPYTATNMSWNAIIQPGQYVEVGFQGTQSGTPEIPVVNGTVCN